MQQRKLVVVNTTIKQLKRNSCWLHHREFLNENFFFSTQCFYKLLQTHERWIRSRNSVGFYLKLKSFNAKKLLASTKKKKTLQKFKVLLVMIFLRFGFYHLVFLAEKKQIKSWTPLIFKMLDFKIKNLMSIKCQTFV